MTTTLTPAVDAPRAPRKTGTTGQLVMFLGGKLVVLASLGVGVWTYDMHSPGRSPTFQDLSDLAQDHLMSGFAALWFAALNWLVLGVAVLVGVLGTVGLRFNVMTRVAGATIALTGVGGALLGAEHKVGWDGIPAQLGLGAYLTIAGYLLIAVGCALGPWRPRS